MYFIVSHVHSRFARPSSIVQENENAEKTHRGPSCPPSIASCGACRPRGVTRSDGVTQVIHKRYLGTWGLLGACDRPPSDGRRTPRYRYRCDVCIPRCV